MEEKIGKVILDTTCYPGKDLYSDGAIEDEMLAISRDFAPEEFNRVCNTLSVYASSLKYTPGNEAFFEEHLECIVADEALQKLALI